MNKEAEYRRLLERVLDDATGCSALNDHSVRVWAIRSKLRREIMESIDYEYNEDRSLNNPDYPRGKFPKPVPFCPKVAKKFLNNEQN